MGPQRHFLWSSRIILEIQLFLKVKKEKNLQAAAAESCNQPPIVNPGFSSYSQAPLHMSSLPFKMYTGGHENM